jgi:hypothetical protein
MRYYDKNNEREKSTQKGLREQWNPGDASHYIIDLPFPAMLLVPPNKSSWSVHPPLAIKCPSQLFDSLPLWPFGLDQVR